MDLPTARLLYSSKALHPYTDGQTDEGSIVALHGLGAHPDHTWCYDLDQHRTDSSYDADASEQGTQTKEVPEGKPPRKADRKERWQAWVKNKASVRWLNWLKDEDMLPAAFQDARIMRYGYLSEWKGDGRVTTRVSLISKDLLPLIKRERKVTRDISLHSFVLIHQFVLSADDLRTTLSVH